MTQTERTIQSESYITGVQTIESSSYISSTNQSLESYSIISEPGTTILCDGQIINEIVDEFGVKVVVRKITKTVPDSDDPYSTTVTGYTDYKRVVLLQTWTADDTEVREGNYKAGEVTFVFEVTDKDLAVPGNRILYAGTWYEIQRVTRYQMQDTLYMIEARVRKV